MKQCKVNMSTSSADISEDDELLMLLLFLSAELAADLDKQTVEFIREERCRTRSLPEKKDRPTWSSFAEQASVLNAACVI